MQLDSYQEVPKDKRPPDNLIWWGTTEDVEGWFDMVFSSKGKEEAIMDIDPRDIG